MENSQGIRVGVGVMIFKDGKVLIGKRKSELGTGEWAWPGGHLEYGESIEACCRRETREETGIEIENIKFCRLVNFARTLSDSHYVDIGMIADWKSGDPKLMEPEKYELWEWRDLNDLPEPLFPPEPFYLKALETGQTFFDS